MSLCLCVCVCVCVCVCLCVSHHTKSHTNAAPLSPHPNTHTRAHTSQSKSTPLGAVVKFAAGGKARPKKELGIMTMEGYPDTYVASVCLEANYNQVVKAMTEAEAHPGVSLVIAYAPCALQGPDGGMSKSQTVRGWGGVGAGG